MKLGAGIAGILLGLFSLLYVGLFGGLIGAGAGWLGSIGPANSAIINWASEVSLLSWLAPLLAIIGGIVTFSNPRAGGVMLAASACLLWYLIGLGMIGKLFVFPIAAAAILAFSADRSAARVIPSAPITPTPASFRQSGSLPSHEVASFDRVKWNALIQYDDEIAAVAERLRPLGQRWLDEFASSYLALNDKQYLSSIEQKVLAAANVEADENEKRALRTQEFENARLQEQKHLADERRRQIQIWRERLWGGRRSKIRTTIGVTAAVLLASTVVGSLLLQKAAEERKMARTALLIQAVKSDDWAQARHLVDGGVDVNAAIGELDGRTWTMVPVLIKAIIKSNSGDKYSLDVANALLDNGADPNVEYGFGLTPIDITSNPSLLSKLLTRGANVNRRGRGGVTPLMTASSCFVYEKLSLLVKHNANVNVRSDDGTTPLHLAAGSRLSCVKILVENGADVHARNVDGRTPLDLSLGHPDISAYLQEHGAAGDIPILLSAPSRNRQPAYDAALKAIFNISANFDTFDTPSWLARIGLDHLQQSGRVIMINGRKYEYYDVCEPHNCGTNWLHMLFTPNGGEAWALSVENQRQLRFRGNPSEAQKGVLMGEYRSSCRRIGCAP